MSTDNLTFLLIGHPGNGLTYVTKLAIEKLALDGIKVATSNIPTTINPTTVYLDIYNNNYDIFIATHAIGNKIPLQKHNFDSLKMIGEKFQKNTKVFLLGEYNEKMKQEIIDTLSFNGIKDFLLVCQNKEEIYSKISMFVLEKELKSTPLPPKSPIKIKI